MSEIASAPSKTSVASTPVMSFVLDYPQARETEQIDDYFGTKVDDPYRWMEDVDSPELAAWVEAENRLTQSYLAEVPSRPAMQARLMALMDFERYTVPAGFHLAGGGMRYFYQHNSGLQNQAVVYWQDGLGGERKVLLDPNAMSADGNGSTERVQRDGRWPAGGVCDLGSG